MKKVRWTGVLLLIVGLVMSAVGCIEFYESPKATGGGWFYEDGTGDKVTFGFTAIPTGVIENGDTTYVAKGKFQLVDHNDGTVVHGTFLIQSIDELFEGESEFCGECSLDGIDGYFFGCWFLDNGEPGASEGDEIYVLISDGDLFSLEYSGQLQGGNIKVHNAKK